MLGAFLTFILAMSEISSQMILFPLSKAEEGHICKLQTPHDHYCLEQHFDVLPVVRR